MSLVSTVKDVIATCQKSMMLCHTIVFSIKGSAELLHGIHVGLRNPLRKSMLTRVTPLIYLLIHLSTLL